MEEYVFSTEKNQLRMFEKVRKKVRVNAQEYKKVLKAQDSDQPRKPNQTPFEALKFGEDYFISQWLK